MPEKHELMGGELRLYKRPDATHWYCAAFMLGKTWKKSTKEESLAKAKDFAEDWFLDLKGKARYGEIKAGKTFKLASTQFLREIDVLTAGERSPTYVQEHKRRLDVHLLPFFGLKALTEITPGLVQEYRIHRQTSRLDRKTGLPGKPARNTLHQEIVTLRQVLKTAERHGWLPYLPSLAEPFRGSGKISHRGWFSRDEYKSLYQETSRRAAKPGKARWAWSSEQLHDYVLFMANTGLRPDEASRLEFRDIEIVDDEDSGERILEIEVRGKRGIGYCKSMPGAVLPFERLQKRLRTKDSEGNLCEGRNSVSETRFKEMADINEKADGKKRSSATIYREKPKPNDLIFPIFHRELFNDVLDTLGLKVDRDGQARTSYSLRHSYICFRLLEGADIYQLAKNCRTSVEMIQKYYADHLKNMLDASAINVRKLKRRKVASKIVEKPED